MLFPCKFFRATAFTFYDAKDAKMRLRDSAKDARAASCDRFAAQSLRSFGQPDRFATGASHYRSAYASHRRATSNPALL